MSYVRLEPARKTSSSTYLCVARSITDAWKPRPPIRVAPVTAAATTHTAAATNALLASKVCGFISASCPFVSRDRRVRAHRPRANNLAIGEFRRGNLRRRSSRLPPPIHRRHHIERAGAVAASAVAHPRNHEQPHGVAHRLPARRRLQDALVVVHGV